MKQKRTIIILAVIAVAVALITTYILAINSRCVVDGTTICLDKDTRMFKLEEKATLTVQVESDSMKQYLVDTWNTLHPDSDTVLDVVVAAPLSLETLAQGLPYDVMITSQQNAAYLVDQVYDLGSSVQDEILFSVPQLLVDASNLKKVVFVPNSINGWRFVYNKTLAEELGFDLTDTNGSGLPDAFSSWEKIFDLETKIHESIDVVFPLTFTDQESFYPFLTSGRWVLNFTNQGSDPGYSHKEFLNGLSLIEAFSDVNLYRNTEAKKPASELPWAYETAFYDRQSLFTIASDWMQLEEHQAVSEDTYVYAPFPSYNGYTLTPMASVDGYVVKGTVNYPSTAAEVLRILRLPEAATHYKSESNKTFLYSKQNIDKLTVSDEEKNLIRAYSTSDSYPVMTLDKNPKVLSRYIYQEVAIMDVLRDLYDGKLTKEEAQEEIVKRADAWIKSHENEAKADE